MSQAVPSGSGERVETRFPVVGRDAPGGRDPTLAFESLQGGVKGPVLHQQFVAGAFLDLAGNALAVLRPEQEGAEDQQIERTLQER